MSVDHMMELRKFGVIICTEHVGVDEKLLFRFHWFYSCITATGVDLGFSEVRG